MQIGAPGLSALLSPCFLGQEVVSGKTSPRVNLCHHLSKGHNDTGLYRTRVHALNASSKKPDLLHISSIGGGQENESEMGGLGEDGDPTLCVHAITT